MESVEASAQTTRPASQGDPAGSAGTAATGQPATATGQPMAAAGRPATAAGSACAGSTGRPPGPAWPPGGGRHRSDEFLAPGTVLPDSGDEPRLATGVSKAIARHVRALRLARGWSLDSLSVRSGVSKGMLVQVEGARTNPSVGTLCRIADAFGVTVGRLVEPTSDREVHVSPAAAAQLLWRGGYGGFARLLGTLGEPEPMELREWVLQPKDRYHAADQFPGTRELLHVLVGEAVVVVGGAEHKVRAGDTIDLPADRARSYRNNGDKPCRMIQVRAWAAHERDHPNPH